MDYSVLMSVYRKENPSYLEEAIESMLHQTVAPRDFVIVCDGELTDELYRVINRFTSECPSLFQVIQLEKNMGLGLALNQGLAVCKYELVARMDSDDIALSDRMEKQLNAFSQNPDFSVIGGQIAEFEKTPNEITRYRIVPESEKDITHKLKFSNPVNHVTVLYQKSHVMAVGGYPHHPGFEDYRLWIELLFQGYRICNLSHIFCNVRADSDMLGRRKGFSYFKNTLKLENVLLSKKIISLWEYLVNVCIRFGGTVLLPPKLQKKLFSYLMRKQTI